MAIIRITIRTFQNEEHAQLFLAVSDQTIPALEERGIRVNAKIAITQNKEHEVISVWEYDDEAHAVFCYEHGHAPDDKYKPRRPRFPMG